MAFKWILTNIFENGHSTEFFQHLINYPCLSHGTTCQQRRSPMMWMSSKPKANAANVTAFLFVTSSAPLFIIFSSPSHFAPLIHVLLSRFCLLFAAPFFTLSSNGLISVVFHVFTLTIKCWVSIFCLWTFWFIFKICFLFWHFNRFDFEMNLNII